MGHEGNEGDEGYESDERDEGDEGDEGDAGNEGRHPTVERRPRRGARVEDRPEKVGMLETHRSSWGHWRQGGEEQGVVHSPRTVQDQDEGEAGDQGREEDDVRQGGCGEGEAGEDRGQGVRRLVAEAEHLRSSAPWGFPRGPPSNFRISLSPSVKRSIQLPAEHKLS